MINRQVGFVTGVKHVCAGLVEIDVMVAGREVKAYAFPLQTGEVKPHDRVILNTTAVDLGLGSGGHHFVMANLDGECVQAHPGGEHVQMTGLSQNNGHIMKLRYTPFQVKVWAVEEQHHPHHEAITRAQTLEGTPVLGGSLHSMLVPCVCGIKAADCSLRVAYVMTDGGALPLVLSKAVRALKEEGLLYGTVTTGHAFGGDCEAVNLYSGLLAARVILRAQVIVALMGPGVVGTATRWGNTALEVGQIINATVSLKGTSYTIPRLSFADSRRRHYGLSHHTITALEDVALGTTRLVLPELAPEKKEALLAQLKGREINRHHLVWGRGEDGLRLAHDLGLKMEHMGRSYQEDPAFFLAASASGEAVARAIRERREKKV